MNSVWSNAHICKLSVYLFSVLCFEEMLDGS